MAVHILGSTHSVADYYHLRVWAEDGLVKIEDARDNGYEVLQVREFLKRLKAINDMKGAIDGTESAELKAAICEERTAIDRFVERAIPVARKAQEQGMPSDKSAKNSLAAARPKNFVMSGKDTSMEI